MARRPRLQVAGAIFHAWARRVDRWPLFVDDHDFERYIALLARTVEEHEWLLMSFCLMPNHVHLLIKLRDPNLARGIQKLHGSYVRWFNDRHDRTGRLFEHRYGSKLVADELYLLTVLRYIEANPVAAGLCDEAQTWRWSSCGILGSGTRPKWIADYVAERALSELKDAT